MSASSSKKVKDERVALRKIRKPRWLEAFLKKNFFEACTTHPYHRNLLNKYCINCNQSACQHCVSGGPHRHHKILKIYRHVYKDVVSLAAMEKYIDSSQIQPFRCNKRLVISLDPLPHCGSAINNESSCDTCSRRLTEPDLYRYCSISCKVTAFLTKANDSDPPFIAIQTTLPPPPPPPTPPPPPQEKPEEPAEPPKRASKRKGIPRRAPFF